MGKYHKVRQGECFSSLAYKYGFESYRTIFNHPENEELKKRRQNANVLYPDDIVYIPFNELKEVDAGTEQRHRFQLISDKTLFRLVVKDSEEKPFANARYELKIDREIYQGTTDNDGKLEQKIPANARRGGLLLYAEDEEGEKVIGMFSLKLGHLDPVEEITGVQSRLNNLGFGCGKTDGILGKRTAEALREFQEKNGLPVTGAADPATREKLRQLHDWQ